MTMFSVSFTLICLMFNNNEFSEIVTKKTIGPFNSYSEAQIHERKGSSPIFKELGECKVVSSLISRKEATTLAKNYERGIK